MLRKWPDVPVDIDGLSTQKLSLDSEYHLRWIEFHMSDGTVLDSRHINWRHVKWEQVVKLVVSIRDHRHSLDRMHCIGFKCFLNFRKQSHLNKPARDGGYGGAQIVKTWCIGWTDGKWAYITDVSFHTGNIVREYRKPLDNVLGFIHPRCRAGLDEASQFLVVSDFQENERKEGHT